MEVVPRGTGLMSLEANAYSPPIDLLHLQGLPLILASTCDKAIFRSLFGPSRRDLACCQRNPKHIFYEFYRQDLEKDDMVQMRSEKLLCSRWMRIWTASPVNAKGLIGVPSAIIANFVYISLITNRNARFLARYRQPIVQNSKSRSSKVIERL